MGKLLLFVDTQLHTLIFQIGCCVDYIGSDLPVAQCNVQNCTTIALNNSRAECYRSRLNDDSALNECHRQLLTTLSLVYTFIISLFIVIKLLIYKG